ncbi:type II toxin-antitoxin system prevent-host-death family antitoxin [Microbacterium sp.]|uniref:type II toxin-antitoxin system prevent-host-death family antitoxin n=1 Tax=Microbacterium sp. TaxID=51671 RepID=UPI003F9C988F
MTARDFNQQVGRAQRVADGEPVMVTRHGEPAYVLLSITEYERLNRARGTTLSMIDELEKLGQVTTATRSVRELARPTATSEVSTADIVADVRGHDRGY